jgi:hypothetical protein
VAMVGSGTGGLRLSQCTAGRSVTSAPSQWWNLTTGLAGEGYFDSFIKGSQCEWAPSALEHSADRVLDRCIA